MLQSQSLCTVRSSDTGRALKAGCSGSTINERVGKVIAYCACPNEASAAVVAKKLMRAGFRRVRPLGGGIEAWMAKGYAVEGRE